MIAIAIAAILASIAIPAYHDHVIRAKRLDGQTALLDLASRMEQYYSQHQTYQTATIGRGDAQDVLASSLTPAGWYTLAIVIQNDSDYSLKAIPLGNDPACQSLTFNSQGVKGTTNGSPASCW